MCATSGPTDASGRPGCGTHGSLALTGLNLEGMLQAEVCVDLGAIRENVGLLKGMTGAGVMAVVKADGYGHGMVPAARAALAGGASWIGAATLDEALKLRRAGITA